MSTLGDEGKKDKRSALGKLKVAQQLRIVDLEVFSVLLVLEKVCLGDLSLFIQHRGARRFTDKDLRQKGLYLHGDVIKKEPEKVVGGIMRRKKRDYNCMATFFPFRNVVAKKKKKLNHKKVPKL
jgi:hypothetical protein